MKNPAIPKYLRRPLVLFPEGWHEGWMNPEIADGSIPLYLAEAYIAQIAKPQGERHTYPFAKLPTTRKGWREWREHYYLEMCTSPFGYVGKGISHAPHGMSIHGVPKLHPDDE